MTMVERVAKAIYTINAIEHVEKTGQTRIAYAALAAEGREMLARMARAAIEEMRQPTDEMVDAGHEANDSDHDGPRRQDTRNVWRAMVNRALKL